MKRFIFVVSILFAFSIHPSGFARAESFDTAIPNESAVSAVSSSEGDAEDAEVTDSFMNDLQPANNLQSETNGDKDESIDASQPEQIADEPPSGEIESETPKSKSDPTISTSSELEDARISEEIPPTQPDSEFDSESEPVVPSISDGVYVIRSLNAEREVLDVALCSQEDGANTLIWDSNGGSNQRWVVESQEDGSVILRSVLSNKLLDIAFAENHPGANVIQWSDNGCLNQRWRIIPSGDGFQIVSCLSDNLVLDVYGAKKVNGSNVIVYSPNGGANQLWEFVSVPSYIEPGATVEEGWYRIEAAEDVVLDVAFESLSSGSNIGLWSDKSGANQAFYLSFDDGYATITAGTGLRVATTGPDPIPGSNVFQQTASSLDSQRFALEMAGDGLWKLRNVANGLYLDASTGESGENVYSSLRGLSVSLTPITSFIAEDGPYLIAPQNAPKLVVEASDTSESLILDASFGGFFQKWFIEKVDDADNTYNLRSAASGLVLTASDNSVFLSSECSQDLSQQWLVSPLLGGWVFENVSTGAVLDVAHESNNRGAPLCVWSSNLGANQRFTLRSTPLIEDGITITISLAGFENEVIDVNLCSKSDNAQVSLWSANGGQNQQWKVMDRGNGVYRLVNVLSGKYLTVSQNGSLTQHSANNGMTQDWSFDYDRDSGTFSIVAFDQNGNHVSSAGTSNGSSVVVSSTDFEYTSFRFNVQYPLEQRLSDASESQKRLAALAWREPTTPSGYCAMWVHNVFEAYGIYDVYGNANDLYYDYCTSSSLYDLKVGMIVAVSRHPGTSGGRIYGHIGIYVGDGIMLDSSGSVRVWNVEDWINSYNGWVTPKWGWYGNRKLG